MSQDVVVLDYGSGNLRSAERALTRAGADVVVTADLDAAREADGLVVPGVGAFAACMAGIDEIGAAPVVHERLADERPVLGICVGMQVLFDRGVEHGHDAEGCGEWPGVVEQLEAPVLPHMGWNTLEMVREHPVLERLPLGDKGRHAYFVHSYQLNAVNEADVLARAEYGGPVTAIVGRDTMIGTQFHPEKSQRFGLALIQNFLKWKP